MNRIDRLFAILLLLQRSRRIRSIDLARRFEISERTVYRDMHALVEMGVPVVALPGEGYELLETFRLPPVMLTSEEATALFLAGQMLMRMGEGHIALHAETALQKVEAVLPRLAKDRMLKMAGAIDFFPTQTRLNWDEPFLIQIIDAIDARHIIQLIYRNYKDSTETERIVEPHQIMFADGAWYVNGYCRLRRDMRVFRLNRISSLVVKNETFEHRMILPAKIEAIKVTVRFSAQILPHVQERQHYAFVGEEGDTLIYLVHTLDEIQNWLFGFGADAHVLSPKRLQDWIIQEAQRLIKLLT